jgi:hypothetical protein
MTITNEKKMRMNFAHKVFVTNKYHQLFQHQLYHVSNELNK